jgi:hypothetical protein
LDLGYWYLAKYILDCNNKKREKGSMQNDTLNKEIMGVNILREQNY